MSKDAALVYVAITTLAGVGVLVEYIFTWHRKRKAYRDFNAYPRRNQQIVREEL